MWVEISSLLGGKFPWNRHLFDPVQDLHLPYKHFAKGLASHEWLSNDIWEFMWQKWQWKEEFNLWVIHGIHWWLMQIIQSSFTQHLGIDLLELGQGMW